MAGFGGVWGGLVEVDDFLWCGDGGHGSWLLYHYWDWWQEEVGWVDGRGDPLDRWARITRKNCSLS